MNNFAKPGPNGTLRCAMLFNVLNRQCIHTARILLLKPNVTAWLSVDVINYANAHPTFPNESTADPFFNEAQFESYRQLGLQIGQTLFGKGQSTRLCEALWGYLQEKPSEDANANIENG